MVNQLSKFSEHLADKTKSIKDLLCKGNQWTWGTEQQKAFEQIKADLTWVSVLALYDQDSSWCRILWLRRSISSALTRQLLATSFLHVESDDSHRDQIGADRKGGLSAHMGMWTIVEVHRGRVDLCGSGPWTLRSTTEWAHTGSTPTEDPAIQNATDEIPL